MPVNAMNLNTKISMLPYHKVARNLSITRTPLVKTAELVKKLKEPNFQERLNRESIERVMREAASEESPSTASDELETENQEPSDDRQPSGKWKIVLAGVVSLSVIGGLGYYALKE